METSVPIFSSKSERSRSPKAKTWTVADQPWVRSQRPTIVISNLLSTPETLDVRPHIMWTLGADIFSCLKQSFVKLYFLALRRRRVVSWISHKWANCTYT